MTPGLSRRGFLAGTAAAAGTAVSFGSPVSAATAPAGASRRRVATWGAGSYVLSGVSVANATARQIVHVSSGGVLPQIRFSNVGNPEALTLNEVWLGQHAGDGAVKTGTNRQVTFGGATSVTIPPGAQALSDPVTLTVASESDLAVSVHVAATVATVTGHSIAAQRSYVSTGNHASEESAGAYSTTISKWYWTDEISVDIAGSTPGTVVCLGDSITDGVGSGANTNQRWPDHLARRLLGISAPLGVVNAGISGNRVLADGASASAQARLDRDVLSRPNVRTLVLLEGINDIGTGRATSSAQLIAGYQQIVARSHLHGIRVIGSTITPWLGSSGFTAAKEAVRTGVNTAIRSGDIFDGWADFEAAIRDPAEPLRMLAAYDSGGGVHPNAAGYQAMANSIDLALITA